jgi:hypothetical protein
MLTVLSQSPSITAIHAYTRKTLSTPKTVPLSSSDSSAWPSLYPSSAQIFFSGLATTRAIAGGFENQRKIDFDLNLALATAGTLRSLVSSFLTQFW